MYKTLQLDLILMKKLHPALSSTSQYSVILSSFPKRIRVPHIPGFLCALKYLSALIFNRVNVFQVCIYCKFLHCSLYTIAWMDLVLFKNTQRRGEGEAVAGRKHLQLSDPACRYPAAQTTWAVFNYLNMRSILKPKCDTIFYKSKWQRRNQSLCSQLSP